MVRTCVANLIRHRMKVRVVAREYDQVPRDVKPIYSEYVIPFVAFPLKVSSRDLHDGCYGDARPVASKT